MLHRAIFNGLRGIAATFIAYPLAERIEGRDVRRKTRILACEMALAFSERRERSWAALVDTVRFAEAKVPYYRDLFARIGFDPEKLIGDPRYLNDIPYLTKDIIRAEGERLLRDDHAQFRRHTSKTGGSTGPSAHIHYDQEAADWSSAVTRHARAGIGHSSARSELHFASRFPSAFPLRDRVRERVKCFAMNRYNIFFSSFDSDELEAIWSVLRSIHPHLVHAHPSTIYHLALHIRARHGSSRAFRIFESSGEALNQQQRDVISQALLCEVFDRYGLAEIGVVAYQISATDRSLVVFDPFAWPELAVCEGMETLALQDGARAGELVLTGLKNRMMPLIRYRSGDIAVMSETARGFVIREMVGRVHDVINVAGQRTPTHYIQDVLDRAGGVKTFQIEIIGDKPSLRLVPEEGADTETIRHNIEGWWGDAIGVEFVDVSELKLQGWRAKFRHLVTEPSAPPSPVTDRVKPQ